MKCKHGTILYGAKCLNCEIEARNKYPASLERITEVAVRRAELEIARYKRIDEFKDHGFFWRRHWGMSPMRENPLFFTGVTA